MKNMLRIDRDNGLIIMDRTFSAKSSIVGSREYEMLTACCPANPTFTVVRRHIKKNNDQERYKGLTYGYIENYIETHDSAEENMKTYKELRLIAECHSVRYPAIKKWFLETYPDVSKFGLELGETDPQIIPVDFSSDMKRNESEDKAS